MSTYTTTLRNICENYAGRKEHGGYSDIDDVIEKSWNKVFDFYFPIWSEDYRETLCKKIICHFYMCEIGLETVGLWKFYLQMKLNEIMPLYNKLYETTIYDINPIYTTNYIREYTKTGDHGKNTVSSAESHSDSDKKLNQNQSKTGTNIEDSTSHNEGENTESIDKQSASSNTEHDSAEDNFASSKNSISDSTHYNYQNDTPQGGLSGIENLNYLSSVTKETTDNNANESADESKTSISTHDRTIDETETGTVSNTKSDTETYKKESGFDESETSELTEKMEGNGTSSHNEKETGTTNESFTESVNGYQGINVGEIIKKYRETLLNIDMMIIEELSSLFMLIY